MSDQANLNGESHQCTDCMEEISGSEWRSLFCLDHFLHMGPIQFRYALITML
jgi:hypothetical protein